MCGLAFSLTAAMVKKRAGAVARTSWGGDLMQNQQRKDTQDKIK
jgi:hypothetical protein